MIDIYDDDFENRITNLLNEFKLTADEMMLEIKK